MLLNYLFCILIHSYNWYCTHRQCRGLPLPAFGREVGVKGSVAGPVKVHTGTNQVKVLILVNNYSSVKDILTLEPQLFCCDFSYFFETIDVYLQVHV